MSFRKYRVVAAKGAHLPAGTLLYGLTPDQIDRRAALLSRQSKTVHRAERPVFFKTGETVVLDDVEVSKAALGALAAIDTPPAAKAKPRARAPVATDDDEAPAAPAEG